MSYYDLDLQRIEQQLRYLQRCRQVIAIMNSEQRSERHFFALSRAIHVAVEAMIDVGTAMIDGFVMRDPGGYTDIVDILEDERVLTAEVAVILREWVLVRDRLIRRYTELDWADCQPCIEQIDALDKFVEQVHAYIEREA